MPSVVKVRPQKRSGNGECKAHPKAEDGRRREAQNRDEPQVCGLLFGLFSCSSTPTD